MNYSAARNRYYNRIRALTLHSVVSSLSLSAILSLVLAAAVEAQSSELAVCSGWNPETKSWGFVGAEGVEFNAKNCPADHAVVAVRFPGGPRRRGRYIGLTASCCPLPAKALTDEHSFVDEQCPDGSVVTGAKIDRKQPSLKTSKREYPAYSLRCTKLDPARYELGPEGGGLYTHWFMHYRSMFMKSTTFERIPLALRLGVGRMSKFGWNKLVCIGYPWGSLLTGRSQKYCDSHQFRPLQNREALKEAAALALDYQACLAVDDQYSEAPRCVLQRQPR